MARDTYLHPGGLVGSYIFYYFTPKNWKNDPILQAYVSRGLVETTKQFMDG